jgi:type IV pilus assembly protein PilB
MFSIKMLKYFYMNPDEDKTKTKLDYLRRQEEEEVVQLIARRNGYAYVNLHQISINTDALRLIPENEALAAKMGAYELINKKLSVAIMSPKNPLTMQVLDRLDRAGYELKIFVASESSLEKIWGHYQDLSYAQTTRAGSLEISAQSIADIISKAKDIPGIKQLIQDAVSSHQSYRVSIIIETILAGALGTGASDIHLEPEETYARLRYRLDGVLVDVLDFDNDTLKSLIARLKLLSGMILNIHNKAQDGRFSIKLSDKEIEIRSSILPGAYSESMVMRVLHPDSISVKVEELGMDQWLLDILLKEITKPNGMILTTGPTGSGKTTTLYSFLRKIHTPEIKIITIEDPIEYHLPGIVQTQTDADAGYTFLAGLRAALRQDPDVIMVGEIRDAETAGIAVQSALTGHLVFSTLHTNDAAGTFPRLVNLGINPRDTVSAMNVAMAQRLLRKVCQNCHKQVPLTAEQKTFFGKVTDSIRNRKLVEGIQTENIYEAVGCEKCNGTGYKGRIGIFEIILKNEALQQELIKENPNEKAIKKIGLDQGMLDMRQDGILKILRGLTTLDELSRVIDLDEEIL